MRRFLRALFATREERDNARQRGNALLRTNLTGQQRNQLDVDGWFEVVGGTTGHRYRIHRKSVVNVEELDGAGRPLQHWCFGPPGLVEGDVLLAQKLALELFETEALAIANLHRQGFPTLNRLCPGRPR